MRFFNILSRNDSNVVPGSSRGYSRPKRLSSKPSKLVMIMIVVKKGVVHGDKIIHKKLIFGVDERRFR